MAVNIKGNRITRVVDEKAILGGIVERWTKGVVAALADETSQVTIDHEVDGIDIVQQRGDEPWKIKVGIASMLKAAGGKDRQQFIRETIIAQMRVLQASARIGFSSGRVMTSITGVMPGGGGVPAEIPLQFHRKVHSGLETGTAIRKFVEKYHGYKPIMTAYATIVDLASRESEEGKRDADPELVMAYMAMTGMSPTGREKMYDHLLPHVERRLKARSVKSKIGVDVAFDIALQEVQWLYHEDGKKAAAVNNAIKPVMPTDTEGLKETGNALLDSLMGQYNSLVEQHGKSDRDKKIEEKRNAQPGIVFTPVARPIGIEKADWKIVDAGNSKSCADLNEEAAQAAADDGSLQDVLGGAGAGIFQEFMESIEGEQPQPLEPEEEHIADEIAEYLKSLSVDKNRSVWRPARKHGQLDSKRLIGIVTGDSFLKRRIKKDSVGMDVGVVIDYSGSMQGRNCMDATATARVLRAGIQRAGQVCHTAFFSESVMLADEVPLKAETNKVYQHFGGGTNTCGSIRSLMTEMNKKQKNQIKIIFVVTDGAPGDPPERQAAALEEAEREGFHVVNVLFSEHGSGHVPMTQYAHQDHVVKNINWLPNIVMDVCDERMKSHGIEV